MILARSFQDFVNSMMHVRLTSKMVYYIPLSMSHFGAEPETFSRCSWVTWRCLLYCGKRWLSQLVRLSLMPRTIQNDAVTTNSW